MLTVSNGTKYDLVHSSILFTKCFALLDAGSGSSYASEAIIDLIKINLIWKEY